MKPSSLLWQRTTGQRQKTIHNIRLQGIARILCIALFITGPIPLHAMKKQDTVPLRWKTGYADNRNDRPGKFYEASVPGAVQLDYMKGENLPPYYIDDHFRDYHFLEDKFWRYRTEFMKPEIPAGHHLHFISKGIDYEFEIILNGQVLHRQEGMFTPVDLILDDHLNEENILEVLIHPIPKAPSEKPGKRQARNSAKPAVPYGWDWHPRLVPVGIWDETYLAVRPATMIIFEELNYTLSEDLSSADLEYTLQVSHPAGMVYQWEMTGPDGNKVLDMKGEASAEMTLPATIPNVELWWPHDHGTPVLYSSTLTLINEKGKIPDKVEKKTGFRRIRLVMNEGAWDEPSEYPKTRSVPPFTIEINGRRIFAKGSNWVHPEIFAGTIDRARYREQLLLAKEANFNILRIWGGGITNKESFFELCDSLGIMVWQEFPLACNPYPDDPRYLKILEQEARSIIHRVKQHPSLALWSGGNELFNKWSLMTDQSLPLRLLNSLCYRLDPNTPFIPTSPVMGVGHGHYIFYDHGTGEEVFQVMRMADKTAYTEFGMPGSASVETLKEVIPEKELFPPKRGTAWETHHAFGAWMEDSWLELPTLEKYFGKAPSLEALVKRSQFLQCAGYKCIFETARQQKPYCSMAVNWCYNEPWPTAVNNSLVAYPSKTKPAFYAVAASCRPVLASASFRKFTWEPGEKLEIDCYILNDHYAKVAGQTVDVYLTTAAGKEKLMTWEFPDLEPNTNHHGPLVQTRLPAGLDKQVMTVSLEVRGRESYNSSYHLLYETGDNEGFRLGD